MSYKSVKEIINAVFDSDNNSLNTVYKTDGEVFNLIYDDSGKPALRVNIEGFEGAAGGGIIDGEALTFADLPLASESTGDIYIVQTTTGIPLINRKQAGLYLSDGLAWTLIDIDLQADKVSYSGDLSSDNVMDALNELKAALDGKLSSSGVGNVKFNNIESSDTSSLDWYEEGTWTPVLSGQSVAGVATYTSNRAGFFTRIGNQVNIYATIEISNHTGSGNIIIDGLPYSVKSNDQNEGGFSIGLVRRLNFSGSFITLSAPSGGTAIRVYQAVSGGEFSQVSLSNNLYICFSGTYTT